MRSRVSLGIMFGALLASVSYGQSVFTNPHVLTDSNGAIQGILWNPIGGQPEFRGSGTTPLAGTLRSSFSLYGNDSVFQWLTANVNVGPTTATFDFYSLAKSETLVWTGSDMIPLSITLPGCDVDSHDPDGVQVVGRITFKAKEGATLARAQDDARRQKLWLPANFRLRIGDLPCSRTMKVDPITLVRTEGDFDGDGKVDVIFNPKEYSIEIPAADSPAFEKAFAATVAGTPTDYPMELDYLDDNGNNLLSVVMLCRVIGGGPTNLWLDQTDPNATRTYKLAAVKDASKGFSNIIR